MATLPITDLLAEREILALQALDFGAQLEHFPARVLDWVNQLRGGAARTTDLYQMANHDRLGLPRRPRFGKRRVPFYPPQTDLYGRDRRSFTIARVLVVDRSLLRTNQGGIEPENEPSMRGRLSSEAVQILCRRAPAHPLRRRLRSILPISDLSADDSVCTPRHIL